LRTELWYAAARVATSPLRDVERPAATLLRTPASAAFDFSARLCAARLLRAVASAGFWAGGGEAVVGRGAVVVVDGLGVVEVDGVAVDATATGVARGSPAAPPPVEHPPIDAATAAAANTPTAFFTTGSPRPAFCPVSHQGRRGTAVFGEVLHLPPTGLRHLTETGVDTEYAYRT
jgi:hypothetical protein